MKIKDLSIIFMVTNLERTRRFYADVLEIELERHEGYLLASLTDSLSLTFFEGEVKPGNSPQFVFGLEDGGIEAVAERLAAKGVELVTPVTEAPGGWSVDFLDPDRHLLSFYQSAELPR